MAPRAEWDSDGKDKANGEIEAPAGPRTILWSRFRQEDTHNESPAWERATASPDVRQTLCGGDGMVSQFFMLMACLRFDLKAALAELLTPPDSRVGG